MFYPTDTPERRERVQQICLAFPEATEQGTQHLSFRIRNKVFAWYLVDHHGDGRVSICTKAAPGGQEMLLSSAPERFFIPSYVGHHGWVGLDMDTGELDWGEVESLVEDSYRLQAPRKLVAAMEARR